MVLKQYIFRAFLERYFMCMTNLFKTACITYYKQTFVELLFGFLGHVVFLFGFFNILFSRLKTNKVCLCFKTQILIWSSWLRPVFLRSVSLWDTGSMSPFAKAKRFSTLETCFCQQTSMNSQGMSVWIRLASRDYSVTYPLHLIPNL